VYDSLVSQTHAAVRKAGFSELMLGLSGGLDSALVAVIAVDALALAAKDGSEKPSQKLHGVIMPSQWTSVRSIDDARELAARLEIRTQALDIMPAYTAIVDTLYPVFTSEPGSQKADTTEENIQARIRAVLLMALSNKFSRLVLATSNLSETSVGYTTLYGDMVGAFAPLAPVYKTWVFELAHFRNQRALSRGEQAPISCSILEKEPSAELSPNQTDQAVLGPYSQLDTLLYILEGLQGELSQRGEGQKIVKEKEIDFAYLERLGFDKDYVRKIAVKVQCSAYKKEQACPGAILPGEIIDLVKHRFAKNLQDL